VLLIPIAIPLFFASKHYYKRVKEREN